MQKIVLTVLENIRNLHLVYYKEFEDLTNSLVERLLEIGGEPLLRPKLVGDPLSLLSELSIGKLQVLEGFAVQLESFGLIGESDGVVKIRQKLLLKLSWLKDVL